MNDYISVEEFLKQSAKVQKQFKEFCKDKFCLCKTNIGIRYVLYLENHTPLLQMHQLVQFIEDKTEDKLTELEYCINPKCNCYPQYKIEKINSNEQNLLQALWQVACKVAEQEGKHGR